MKGRRCRGNCQRWQLGFCFERTSLMALVSITENLREKEEMHLSDAKRSLGRGFPEGILKGKRLETPSPSFVLSFSLIIYFETTVKKFLQESSWSSASPSKYRPSIFPSLFLMIVHYTCKKISKLA